MLYNKQRKAVKTTINYKLKHDSKRGVMKIKLI